MPGSTPSALIRYSNLVREKLGPEIAQALIAQSRDIEALHGFVDTISGFTQDQVGGLFIDQLEIRRLTSRLKFEDAPDVQYIAAATYRVPLMGEWMRLSNTSGGALKLTSLPTVAPGENLQPIGLVNIGTQNIILQDSGILPGSGLHLLSSTVSIPPKGIIRLRYSSDLSLWIQEQPYNGAVVDVRAYGAIGDGIADDTTAIQALINAARSLIAAGAIAGTTIVFSGGSYLVSSLDMTNTQGIELVGVASYGVHLYANKQTVSSKPILDMTGTSSCNIRGISFHGQNRDGTAPATIPSTGILLASSDIQSSNKNRLDDVGIIGHFATSCLFLYGSTDNLFCGCAHQSEKDGIPVLIIDADNVEGMVSPYATISAGTQNTGELSFFQQECHDMSTVTPSTTNTVLIRNSYSVRFYGGNNSNSADASHAHVQIQGTNSRELTFDGVQFYGDHGAALGVIFKAGANTVKNLVIRNCGLETTTTPIMLGGVNGTVYQGLFIEGVDAAYAGTTISIPNNTLATAVIISDAKLFLAGKGFIPGGSVKNIELINPGTITLPAGATWDNVTPPSSFTFAGKPAFTIAGSQIFVTDGTSPSNPLAGGGTGCLAIYQNGALKGY